jgi:hypothetical protein
MFIGDNLDEKGLTFAVDRININPACGCPEADPVADC